MITPTPFARRSWTVAVLLSLLALPTLGGSASAARAHAPARALTKIHMAFSTWTGYGPLVVATKNGFFKKRGLDVTYDVVEDANARLAAIRAGRLDGVATTVDTFTRWVAQGAPVQVVLGIDRSAGGDGIVAKKSITSVKQLKGKTVAVAPGTVSEFFFDYVLQKNGMTINDVKVKEMADSSVAGSTFAANRVDAAVTWEPWLSRAAKTSFGHVLVSSAVYPNIIVDVFGFRNSFVNAHRAAVENFVRAYYDAVNFTKSHPAAANAVIGKYVNETPTQVAGDLTKVPLMGLAQSKTYFGTRSKLGPIYTTAKSAAQFWQRLKIIKNMPGWGFINPGFLQAL